MSTDGCCFLLRLLGPDGCRAYEPTKRSAAKRCGCWRFRPLLLLLSLRTDLAANRPGRVAIAVASAEVRSSPSFPAILLVSEAQAVLPPASGGLHTARTRGRPDPERRLEPGAIQYRGWPLAAAQFREPRNQPISQRAKNRPRRAHR
eukprot:COSAG01_NODE_8667_length_2703_cov_43.714670_2_plen_147_part_00